MESTSQDLSGYGIPTKSTIGNIGDTYTDLNTEIKYKCVAAFSYTGYFLMVRQVLDKPITIEPGEAKTLNVRL